MRGGAVGERCEHRVTVGNRLVARYPDSPRHTRRRQHDRGVRGRSEHAPHYSIRTLESIRFRILITCVFPKNADSTVHPASSLERAALRLAQGVPSVSRRPRHDCMLTRGGTVRLQIHSNFDMLDFVQVVSDRVGQMAGLDDDTIHWIGVAVRESVINAIKHGNREDYGKMVTVEFAFRRPAKPGELIVRVLRPG